MRHVNITLRFRNPEFIFWLIILLLVLFPAGYCVVNFIYWLSEDSILFRNYKLSLCMGILSILFSPLPRMVLMKLAKLEKEI